MSLDLGGCYNLFHLKCLYLLDATDTTNVMTWPNKMNLKRLILLCLSKGNFLWSLNYLIFETYFEMWIGMSCVILEGTLYMA